DKIDARLVRVWPRQARADRAMFEKLKDAYVKARYSKHYKIGADELTWLSARVEELGQAVHAVCTDRIALLERQAAG
ncbi:hypothetical protein ACNJFH_21445, partial [Mycobacterium tuberculosis]